MPILCHVFRWLCVSLDSHIVSWVVKVKQLLVSHGYQHLVDICFRLWAARIKHIEFFESEVVDSLQFFIGSLVFNLLIFDVLDDKSVAPRLDMRQVEVNWILSGWLECAKCDVISIGNVRFLELQERHDTLVPVFFVVLIFEVLQGCLLILVQFFCSFTRALFAQNTLIYS